MEQPDSDTPEKQRDPTVSGPSEEHPRKKRKRRKVACRTCRDRKLRCDLAYPVCGRCAKSDGAEACHYEDPPSWWQQHQQLQAYTVLSEQPSQRPAKASVPGSPQIPFERQRAALNGHYQQPTFQPDSRQIADCDPKYTGSRYFQNSHALLERSACGIQERQPTYGGHSRRGVPSKSLLSGKEHKTRFFGCSNVANLMSEVCRLPIPKFMPRLMGLTSSPS